MLGLGLRTKFFLYSNTLIIVTMGLVAVIGIAHEREVRYEAIRGRGISLTEALAIPITDSLMNEELGLVPETGLIENYITEVLARNQDLMRYVVVADASGVVTHSNRWELMGQRFRRALGPRSATGGAEVEMQTSSAGERLLEVRAPLAISTKFWGSVAVGFSLEPVEKEVRAIGQRAALLALVLMIGNSVLTALYVETLIRPILHLHQTMKRAGRGEYAARAMVRRGDEVGELADAFNRMMDELEEGHEREEVRRSQLLHTEKMAAVGTLAAGVAHEVNNPLAGILTCIEQIRANPEDPELRQRYLDLMEDGIRRIAHIVENLLDFSRPRDIRPEPTPINHNLLHVVELLEYQLRKARVEVKLELDPGEPIVLADHFQMEQLFLNLMLNAMQAMPAGGVMTLRTRVRGALVVVEVIDTGTGIPEEIRDRIFEPFFTTREVGEGTGLGLAVSYSIVTGHRGSIEVESSPGQGSTFRVRLPLREERKGEG
ncbi:MAG: HAMP domain-containing protein [Acidobacteriota bacterium]|jgi:signal transduction histidine kinase